MTDGLHYGTRLVLPDTATTDEVYFFVDGVGFKPGRENFTSYGGEQVWIVSGALYFHYVVNYEIDNAYVQLTHPAVRRGALLSALYLDWPAVRAQVTDMVEHDEVDRLKYEASYFTEKHKRRPSPSE